MRGRAGPGMLAVALLAAGAGAAGGQPPHTAAPMATAEARPNVLLIVTDDQRIGTMSVMKETRRWFRRGGVDYRNAFVTTPLCCPSRASILTGRYAHNHGVITNRNPEALDHRSTLQRYLSEAGYQTAMAGKLMNNWPLGQPPPYFDRWVVQNKGYFRAKFNVQGRIRRIRQYSTDFLSDRAVSYLRGFERRDDAAPWFLYLAPFAPHGPFDPAEEYRFARVPRWKGNPAIDETDRSDKPPFIQDQNVGQAVRRVAREGQLRTLMSVDDMIARVMEELGRLGERGRTLAIFVSDNGFFWGEHRVSDKRLPYEHAIRVPFFARWPGVLPRGVPSGRLTANIDIAPTILEAAGIAPDPAYPVDGRSLLGGAPRDHLLIEYQLDEVVARIPAWASFVDRDRQYVEYYDERGAVVFREYYDLVEDPWQLVNLLGDAEPGNDPSLAEVAGLATTVARDRRCEGSSGPDGCP